MSDVNLKELALCRVDPRVRGKSWEAGRPGNLESRICKGGERSRRGHFFIGTVCALDGLLPIPAKKKKFKMRYSRLKSPRLTKGRLVTLTLDAPYTRRNLAAKIRLRGLRDLSLDDGGKEKIVIALC